eukprot:IDg9862t1
MIRSESLYETSQCADSQGEKGGNFRTKSVIPGFAFWGLRYQYFATRARPLLRQKLYCHGGDFLTATAASSIRVMGPASDIQKLHGLPSRRARNRKNSVARSRGVARWVDMVKEAAEKIENKVFKTVFSILSRQLFSRLPENQQLVVEETQSKSQIYYKQEDQVKAVVEFSDLLAVDPLISDVFRLINSFDK